MGNSHPRALRHKLTAAHFKQRGQWEGTEEQETVLQEQLNEGELPQGDVANEFYPESELPKILPELDTDFKPIAFDSNPSLKAPLLFGARHHMQILRRHVCFVLE